jgi:hypothetical protein
MKPEDYSLLTQFRDLFEGKPYFHRNASQGDKAVRFLYEDLRKLNKSSILSSRIDDKTRVVNTANRTVGIRSRRGDGAFGELVPVALAITDEGFVVARGPLSAIEIGAETKILAKAMIKQIDRVIGDLKRQVEEFKKNADPICIAVVGVNHASAYTSFEGTRSFPTDGTAKYKHPSQEASEAIKRLDAYARPDFDEFLILRFAASNVEPFPFQWINERETLLEYSALLTRVSKLYDRRFGSAS